MDGRRICRQPEQRPEMEKENILGWFLLIFVSLFMYEYVGGEEERWWLRQGELQSVKLAKLEHLGGGSEEVVEGGGVEAEERVGGGGGGGAVAVDAGEDVVEGVEAGGELGGLGAEDGVLGVDGEEALGGEAQRGGDVGVLAAEVGDLRGEVVEVALLPHPRPARRLAHKHTRTAIKLQERLFFRLDFLSVRKNTTLRLILR
uniref:Uncharacterized protein n=1 Tax=Oryza brachyantha TaxID=4533 RepID=J3L9C9_ORYBR